MLLLLKSLAIITSIDYVIYNYYLYNYKMNINKDNYLYRLILRSIFWFIIMFIIIYDFYILDNHIDYYIYISLLSLLIYGFEKLIFCHYNNYCINFVCADLFISILASNIIVFISLYLLK